MLAGETEVMWNFGPANESFIAVEEVINKFLNSYGDKCNVIVEEKGNMAESIDLKLDSTKSRAVLGWEDKLDIDSSINLTAKWYRDFYDNKNPLELTVKQAELFFSHKS